MAKRHQSALVKSIGIIVAGLLSAFMPLPMGNQTVVIVTGSELEEPLKVLEAQFKRENPNIKLEIKVQGSQEVVNKYLDNRNDFKPTILIPANGELLKELDQRWRSQNGSDPFYEAPRPLARTVLVGIAWPERGQKLFPNGQFDWNRVERAMQMGNWKDLGGSAEWGSFDFVMTDPVRSNSGQLTLDLWMTAKLGQPSLTPAVANDPAAQSLVQLAKRSVYQPARSTDILLQEFITRGPNDADVSTIYESIALYRWQQAGASKGKPYQIYYLNPTIETVSTAAIVRRDVNEGTAKAARQFLDFATQPQQQAVFVQYGFRPVKGSIDLKSVPNSPWSQNIPGVEVNLPGTVRPMPDSESLKEVVKLWERAN